VTVADGCLHLGVRLTADPKLRYDCGAVRTRRNRDEAQTMFAMREGYVEARCKLPAHLEADYWGAFWIMAGRITDDQVDTRLGTEIDIMESFTLQPGRHHTATMHWGGYGKHHNAAGVDCGDRPALRDGGFHTFGLRWTAEDYTFTVDGRVVGRTDMRGLGKADEGRTPSQGTCTVPGYLKLTCEAAAWAGADWKWEAVQPERDEFVVDWVRAYRPEARE
jgi:beta-glucanase (GH16 family)